MQSLDWGHVTPEWFNSTTNEAGYAFNHDISSAEKIDRTIRFVVGRLQYYDLHLPPASKHLVKIDARGQSVSDANCERLKSEIANRYNKKNPLIIEIIRS